MNNSKKVYHCAWLTDSIPRIPWHDCKNLGLWLTFFCQWMPKFLIGVFVPLCRWWSNRDTLIVSQTRYFPYLYNERSNVGKITDIARHCLRCYISSTISERVLLLYLLASKLHVPKIYSKSECVRCTRKVNKCLAVVIMSYLDFWWLQNFNLLVQILI